MSSETKGFTDWVSGYKDSQNPNIDPNPNTFMDLLQKYWWVIALAGLFIYSIN